MHYRNAADILPARLLRELQTYAGGEMLYIPKDGGSRIGWGGRSGAKRHYLERNAEICSRYRSGETCGDLADVYCLSEDSIRKIVKRR